MWYMSGRVKRAHVDSVNILSNFNYPIMNAHKYCVPASRERILLHGKFAHRIVDLINY